MRLLSEGGVGLCTEAFGDPAHPPLLLIMGMGGSMIWWEDEFCGMLAAGGRFVIRYDNRDTGWSVTYDPGRPGYGFPDLVVDATRVLDGYRVPRAHVVGLSMGGAIAQLLALDFSSRVASLVLISTSPAGPGDRGLPPLTDAYARFVAGAEVEWSDAEAVIEHMVADSRALAGGQRPFDEARVRDLARRDVERASNIASAQNHGLLSGGDRWRERLGVITAPTLVIHGTADPLFALEHGVALAEEIPRARLLTLAGSGHGLDRADWDTVARAILEHTGAA